MRPFQPQMILVLLFSDLLILVRIPRFTIINSQLVLTIFVCHLRMLTSSFACNSTESSDTACLTLKTAVVAETKTSAFHFQ